jgi:hypothetical protein
MDFTGEWISREGLELIIETYTKDTVEGKFKLKYTYDNLRIFKFVATVLTMDGDKIKFCFWPDSTFANLKKCMVVKCEIDKKKNLLDANIIKYTVPNQRKSNI